MWPEPKAWRCAEGAWAPHRPLSGGRLEEARSPPDMPARNDVEGKRMPVVTAAWRLSGTRTDEGGGEKNAGGGVRSRRVHGGADAGEEGCVDVAMRARKGIAELKGG